MQVSNNNQIKHNVLAFSFYLLSPLPLQLSSYPPVMQHVSPDHERGSVAEAMIKGGIFQSSPLPCLIATQLINLIISND